MNSYTPLDLNKFKAQSDNSNQLNSAVDPSSGTNTPPPHRTNYTGVLMTFLVLVVAFISGLAYMWWINSDLPNSEAAQQKTPTVQKVEKLIAGTDATFPPMEFTNGTQLTGYDIDMGNKLAEEMSVQIEFINTPWDQVFPDLEQGKIDLIISSVSITDDRKLRYDFSEPYLNAGQVIITNKKNTLITSTDSLKNKKIGVQKGTTSEQEAIKYTSDELVIRYDDYIEATADLTKEVVDAILSDLPGAKGIVDQNPELKIASDPFTTEYYGIVFRKNSSELKNRVDQALNSMQQKGILNSLKEKWLD